jgi:hypothetical protein
MIAVLMGCVVSLTTSGLLTLRHLATATVYWASVPAVEMLACAALLWRRRRRVSMASAIDVFFAGHSTWTLMLIGLAVTLSFLPPHTGWLLLLRVWVWVALAVLAWSAYVDYCFFRYHVGSSRAAALGEVAVNRALVWPAVLAIFALPSMTPSGLSDVVAEIMR